MLKKIVLTLSFLLVPMLALGGQVSTVGVVDAKAVFETSKLAVSGMEYLQAMGGNMEKELRELQAGLGQNATQETQKAFQDAVAKSQSDFGQVQQRIAGTLQERFLAIVEETRKAEGLEVILAKDGVVAFAPAVDVTEKVLAEMDKETVDFKALVNADQSQEASGQE
ncbi:MAG TPA: OmpH family outer membrane protein [Desulfomicrobiaceae bacterium]|nr:OmpH family outer membrane protein [Desulfomicrobiaceae bacterium]